MTGWIRLAAPAALVSAIAPPAYAVQYLSIAQAQKAAFPSATTFTPVDGRAWKAQSGGTALGLIVVDHVIGKHLYIDYSVALDPGGRIKRVDILQYRESYGGEVRDASWVAQFVGKSSGSAMKVGQDIRNISGATLSSQHVTEGVKRIVAAYGNRAR
jgi:hypothetical protein